MNPPVSPGLYAPILERCRLAGPRTAAVVFPCSAEAIGGALEAAGAGLIRPIFVGPEAAIREAAARASLDLGDDAHIVDAPGPREAGAQAAALARSGEAGVIIKGSLHTDEFMGVLVSREAGLRTARRITHCFVMDIPGWPRLLTITDAAINIAPDLKTKRDIVQNAIDLARGLGVALPKVGILSAVETVTADIPSTLDAAALCKMADRGQITGGLLDGPFAFDNVISADAARIKGIRSAVSGEPDILVVPGIEAGNILFKALQYLGGATAAGVVVGARVPIVLTSRADDARTRLLSTAIACAAA